MICSIQYWLKAIGLAIWQYCGCTFQTPMCALPANSSVRGKYELYELEFKSPIRTNSSYSNLTQKQSTKCINILYVIILYFIYACIFMHD